MSVQHDFQKNKVQQEKEVLYIYIRDQVYEQLRHTLTLLSDIH